MNSLPKIIFGTSCLGNLYKAIPYETKLAIATEWFKAYEHPVIDSAGKYGAGLALESIGRTLADLGKTNDDITISVKLGWRRSRRLAPGEEPAFEPGAWKGLEWDAKQDISGKGIIACYEEARELLGGKFDIRMVSVHDPDEFLAAGGRLDDILDAYQALFKLRDDPSSGVEGVGIGAKDWRVIRDLWNCGVRFDWVMFACQPTLLVHPATLREFIILLREGGLRLIDSAVFNGGFLMGSNMLDYREADPVKDADAFAFREKYLALCKKYSLDPAVPAVEYAYRLGFDSVALNTASPRRILQNASYGSAKAPEAFWEELRVPFL